VVKSFLLILTLGAGQDLAMPPAGHGYHTRHQAQINDLGATLQVGPQPLVKKYFDPAPQRTLGDPCKEIFRV
tara:strand:- start:896 stop:1111 length:216 start_codon:yes stop_codon:yes gene_type:complete